MEDGSVELKRRAQRRHKTQNAIEKQKRIAKNAWNSEHLLKQPHRFAKHHAMDCGVPGCMVCGNPRRTMGEPTLQEKKFLTSYEGEWLDIE